MFIYNFKVKPLRLAFVCLQCFDTVCLVSGRVSGLKKLSDEVLAWLSVCSEVQMLCM